jgi:hypothetical protein
MGIKTYPVKMREKRLKKYGEFMKDGSFRKVLSRIVVIGQLDGRFPFSKKKNFELHVFYTPIKKTILKIELEDSQDIKLPDLKLDFKIGDNISKAIESVEKRGWKIHLTFSK